MKLSKGIILIDMDIVFRKRSNGYGYCRWCGILTKRINNKHVECGDCQNLLRKRRERISNIKRRL